MKKKLILSLTLLLICLIGNTQELPKIIPPSPEAASLSEFTNVPVSFYTGLPNISVPIYTIQQKGITIPISLSYHARGVQVSETAPRTGMGWSLLYGGSISRQVRGKPDDTGFQFGYLANRHEFMTYSSNLQTRENVNTREILDPGYDFYPDQFNFNAGAVNGKFVLDYSNGEPVIQSFGDVNISYTRENGSSGNIDSFVITDSRGNIYYYGKSKDGLRTAQDYQNSVGMSIYYNGNVVLDPPVGSEVTYSSWKLMDIETSYGEVISYYYEGEFGGNSAAIYYRKAYDKHTPDQGSSSGVTNAVGNMGNLQEIQTRLSKVWNYEKQLAKIEFNQGRDKIIFTKSQGVRDDFEGHSLDKISIYNENRIIKSFNLNYTYTSSTDQTNLLGYFIGNSEFDKSLKRMFLSSVEEEGSNGQKLPPYTFTYDSTILPSTFSSRQDYWGYYNGATNNGPFTRMFEYGNYTPDRRVDTLKSEAGLLKQIQYPTGGLTNLTYEHNKGRVPFEFNSLKIPSINPGSEDEVEIVLTKADFPYSQTSGYTPYTIQLPPSTQITYRFDCFHFRDIGDTITPDCLFSFLVDGFGVNLNEEVVISTKPSSSYSGYTTIGVLTPRFPGVDPNLHLGVNYDFQITIKYDKPDVRSLLFAAGKRIKKIENISEDGNAIIREYEYNYPIDELSETPSPSGGIIGLPAYLNTKVVGDNNHILITHYNDATSSYSSFQANSIGYSSVIEYQGTKENNIGKTEYTFTNLSDSGGDYYEFPYHPPTDNEWLRGKNIRTKVFENSGNGEYSLVKEIYNKYLYGNNEYTADFKYAGFKYIDFVFTPEAILYDWEESVSSDFIKNRTIFKLPLFMRQGLSTQDATFDPLNDISGYRIYHLIGGTQHLLKTVEKDYFNDGTLEKVTTYDYDYDLHYQLKSSETINSEGEILKAVNYYPVDKDSLTDLSVNAISAATSLESQNRFEILQTEVIKDGVLQARLRNDFMTWILNSTGTDNIILPEIVETSKGANPLETRIVYHAYDNKGNPLEVSKADGTHIVYIWGYQQTQPIAKIENATYSEVSSYVSNLQSLSNLDTDAISENNLRTALNNLRNDATYKNKWQVTTYTYDPLIGVTSITDPRGNTIYYEYDEFNRLEFVKDAEGNIVSKNEYNYKNN